MGRDTDKSGKGSVVRGHRPSRRQLLKGAAAVAGAAAGSNVIGAPVIWAQEIKDIELRHVGVSYSVVKAIGDQAAKDLGFKVTMQNLDTSAAINRFITQPNTVDIPDLEGWQAKLQARALKAVKTTEGEDLLLDDPKSINDLVVDPSRWDFAKDGLVLQFEPYEIAPYAAGAPTVTIPWSDLKDLLAPGYKDVIG